MTDFIDEIMGFNPQDLSAFNEPAANNYDQNIYKTNPKDSKSEDGHYRSKLRVIYNPFDVKQSIVKQTTYAMNDADGFFMVKSKLANGDRECPIFKSWKKLWFSGDESKKDLHESDFAYLMHCRESALFAANVRGWNIITCSDSNHEPVSIDDIAERVLSIVEKNI